MKPKLTVKLDGNYWCVFDENGEEVVSFDRSLWGDLAQAAAIHSKQAYLNGYEAGESSCENEK